MPIEAATGDRVLSRLVGFSGLVLLWPILLAISLAIRLSSGRPVLGRLAIQDHPPFSGLVFACRGPLRDLLRRTSLLMLPILLDLASGRLTMWDLAEIEWRS